MARLSGLQRSIPLTNEDGTPTAQFQMQFQAVVEAIEARAELTGDPTSSAATTTHKVAVNIGGTTYYLLLSDV